MWYDDRLELVAFARALTAAGGANVDGVLYLFEKPWKWDDEHTRWVAAGRPEFVPDEEVRCDAV